MPTPSFIKRLRNNSGKRVSFTYRKGNKHQAITLKVKEVEFTDGGYTLVGMQGNSTRRIPTDRIFRPVRRV